MHFIRKIVFLILHRVIMNNFLRYFIGVEFYTPKLSRNLDQCIIVANHTSHMDAAAILAAMSPQLLQKVHPVVALDYFGRNRLSRWLCRLFLHAIFVSRVKTVDTSSSLDPLRSALARGESLIIFPEGTRGKSRKMGELKRGIAILAKEFPAIPILPAYIEDFDKVLPRGSYVPLPSRCTIRFGSPFLVDRNESVVSILDLVRFKILEAGGVQVDQATVRGLGVLSLSQSKVRIMKAA
jgi:1-acyl-sn-glycerol-3-phosphate acyltransferase